MHLASFLRFDGIYWRDARRSSPLFSPLIFYSCFFYLYRFVHLFCLENNKHVVVALSTRRLEEIKSDYWLQSQLFNPPGHLYDFTFDLRSRFYDLDIASPTTTVRSTTKEGKWPGVDDRTTGFATAVRSTAKFGFLRKDRSELKITVGSWLWTLWHMKTALVGSRLHDSLPPLFPFISLSLMSFVV